MSRWHIRTVLDRPEDLPQRPLRDSLACEAALGPLTTLAVGPDNREARELLADAFTQLGYQAESGPWRNHYLSGAKELRDGVAVLPTPASTSPDLIAAAATNMLLDLLAIRLRPADAVDLEGTTFVVFTDVDERRLSELSNGVLHNRTVGGDDEPTADVTITATRGWLDGVLALDADGVTRRRHVGDPSSAGAARRPPVLVRDRHPVAPPTDVEVSPPA